MSCCKADDSCGFKLLYVLNICALLLAIAGLGLGGYLLVGGILTACSECRIGIIIWMAVFGEVFLLAFFGIAGLCMRSGACLVFAGILIFINMLLSIAMIALFAFGLARWRSVVGPAWTTLTSSAPSVICVVEATGQCRGWSTTCTGTAVTNECPDCAAAGVTGAPTAATNLPTCQTFFGQFTQFWFGILLGISCVFFLLNVWILCLTCSARSEVNKPDTVDQKSQGVPVMTQQQVQMQPFPQGQPAY